MISFKCSETGKEFLIDRYKSKVNTVTKQVEYFESKPGWTLLTNPENGASLVKSDAVQIQMTSIKTETASR
jgi:hypothetical protein